MSKTITTNRLANFYDRISAPRTIIFVIVCLSASIGIGSSYLLFKAGLGMMVIRYPLAFGLGYLGFLLMVRIWAEIERSRMNSDEVKKCGDDAPTEGSGWLDGFQVDPFMVEGGLFVLIFLAFVAFGVLILSIVNAGPIILAEVVFDVALAGTAYKVLAKADKRHWLAAAIKRTYIQALVIFFVLLVAGGTFDILAPNSDTMGKAVHEIINRPKAGD